jgi:hypothetical protein
VWARALIFGSVAFFLGVLGVVGHVTADGLVPGPAALGVLLGMLVLPSAPMLVRQASPLRLVGLLIGGQTAIHLDDSEDGDERSVENVDTAVEVAAREGLRHR